MGAAKMRLSTKGRYGVMAMVELAQSYGQGPMPLKTVAQRTGFSEMYLEQLMGPLRKAGLVQGLRGVSGGYQLASPPEKISVGQIIRALEGSLAPVSCVAEDANDESCRRAGCCSTQWVWAKVRDGINQVVDGITLQDMVDRQSQALSALGEDAASTGEEGCGK